MFVTTLEESGAAYALVIVEGIKEDQEHPKDIQPLLHEYNDVVHERSHMFASDARYSTFN